MTKVPVYHFVNNNVGGVFSVIKNLLQFSQIPMIENHVIYTINKDIQPFFNILNVEEAKSQQIFYYSSKWNFYYTCKQLANLLPNEDVLVIAHDWLELGMVNVLGLQNPVVQFVHGNYDYYYNLSLRHQEIVDSFICVSPIITNKLTSLLNNDKKNAVNYCRFPVPFIKENKIKNSVLKIIYVSSDNLNSPNKQFSLLPEINNMLQKNKTTVNWIIVGRGKTKKEVQTLLNDHDIIYYERIENEELLKLLTTADIFLLPSLKEGFPVAVVEAMKAGLVPLITDWSGATSELIVENETGFYITPQDVESYVKKIMELNIDRQKLNNIALAAKNKANALFDPIKNTQAIESIFINTVIGGRRNKIAEKVYGSRLDKKWIPNFFTNAIRRFYYK